MRKKGGHAQLKKWLKDSNSVVSQYLKVIKFAGGVTNFYLWTNDYSTMNAERKGQAPRNASVWNWEDMFLKYESTVHSDGRCAIPNEEDVINSLRTIAENQEKKEEIISILFNVFLMGIVQKISENKLAVFKIQMEMVKKVMLNNHEDD